MPIKFYPDIGSQSEIDVLQAEIDAKVDSVNGQLNVVLLDTDDIPEGTAKYNQTHTGDVTGATALSIVNDAVTFAKFQNITDNRLLGRSAGSDGDMMHISVGSGLSLSAGSIVSTITQYTDEQAQDAIGTILVGTPTIDLIYSDGTPSITAAVIDDAITYAKLQNFAAYSFIANNTSGAANPTEFGYREPGVQTYAGTITWTGTTAPSGSLTQQYFWTRVGSMVILQIYLKYSVAGTALTSVTFTIPSDVPNPAEYAGQTAADNTLYALMGFMGTTANQMTQARGSVRVNAADNGYLVEVLAASGNFINVTFTAIFRV